VKTPSTTNCYTFRVVSIDKVVDGDTIDVTLDLGFDICKSERVRVAGIDTPEKRTRDLEEKELGIDATEWLEYKLEGAISGEEDLVIRTELKGGVGKYGRLLGWLYIGYPKCDEGCDCECHKQKSLNEEMVEHGYAWEYDGDTKTKDLEYLREIRRSKGTLTSE
jgi:micrococcal nuclease